MTAISAVYGNATTAGNFTLVFSGTTLINSGDWITTFRSNPQRHSPIRRRHNLWSSSVLLDGKYPAIIWNHEFTIYTETGTLNDFANLKNYIETWFDISDRIEGTPQSLQMYDKNGPSGSVQMNFGNCHFIGPAMEEPTDLLLIRAGMVKLRFLGNVKPTVSS